MENRRSMEDKKAKVWFVTGAAKGIGRAIVETVLRQGDRVIAAARKPEEMSGFEEYADQILILRLDVSDPDETVYKQAVEAGVARFGRIDVLVNNAGVGGVTFFEETSEETIRRMFEVNLFGLMRMTRAVLPVMRKQKSGHIFNIASGAGYSAGPVPYHTSKFAVTGFSVSLAFEAAPFGIKVTNVAPGLFRTNFYDKGKWGTDPDCYISDYDSCRWQTGFVADAQKNEQPGDPYKLAELLYEAAYCQEPPLHLAVGEDAPAVLDAYCEQVKADTDKWREKAVQTHF